MDVNAGWKIGYFKDARLSKVGAKLFKNVVKKGHLFIKDLARNRSEQVRYERFLWNSKVTVDEMLKVSKSYVRKAIRLTKTKHVVLIQDTTQCNYKFRKNEVKGLGVIQNDDGPGIFLHPVLAMSADSGFMLGLTACKIWSRDPSRVKNSRKTSPIKAPEEKESYKWTSVVKDSQDALKGVERVTVIADREADLYSMLVDVSSEKTDVLVRSTGTRLAKRVGESRAAKIQYLMKDLPVIDTREIEISKKSVITHKLKQSVRQHRKEAPNGRKARTAKLALRYHKLEIIRPSTPALRDYPETKEVYCIEVSEVSPPKGVVPLSWTLISTREISSVEEAWAIVDLYKKRWLIEIMFKASKKGGYKLEEIEAAKGETIKKLCVLGLIASVRVLQLTFCRDHAEDYSAKMMFSKAEIEAMELLHRSYEGKTAKQKNPHVKHTLKWVHWILGRLGGWKGYVQSEGPAGPIVIKRGLDRLHDMVYAFEVVKDVCTS